MLKQFKRAEKKPDTVGNGDGKEDHSSRGKGKDGEAAGGAQKEEAAAAARADGAAETLKKSDQMTSGDKVKLSGAASESKPESGTVENGNGEGEEDRCGTVEDVDAVHVDEDEDDDGGDDDDDDNDDEMDQSVSPDPVSTTVVLDVRDTSKQDITQETPSVVESERKTKDEGEEGKALQSGTPVVDSANGQMEAKVITSALAMHTSPSAGPKTKPEGSSKSSPSRPSGREEKIPRTDFGTEGDKKAAKGFSESPLSVNKHTDEQTNGKGCEAMDVESPQSSSGQDGNS